MKKIATKAELRAALERETEQFLEEGGAVQCIPNGVSGKDPADTPVYLNRRLFTEPPSERTPIPEVIAALEARRREKYQRKPKRNRARLQQPRRKVIYDDFGEPLRKVWVDD